MNENIRKLAQLLDSHTKDHAALLKLEEEKRQVIIVNNVDRLNEINVEEEEIVKRVSEREEERAALSCLIAEESGAEGERKLEDIISSLKDDKEQKLLSVIRRRLNDVIGKLKYRTEQNAELLVRSVEHIGAFFKTIADARTISPVYCKNGQKNGTQMRLLDHTA